MIPIKKVLTRKYLEDHDLLDDEVLDVAGRGFTDIELGTFRGLFYRAVVLHHNNFKVLKTNMFAGLTVENVLDLSNCNIERMEPGAFNELVLHGVVLLYQDGNKENNNVSY